MCIIITSNKGIFISLTERDLFLRIVKISQKTLKSLKQMFIQIPFLKRLIQKGYVIIILFLVKIDKYYILVVNNSLVNVIVSFTVCTFVVFANDIKHFSHIYSIKKGTRISSFSSSLF